MKSLEESVTTAMDGSDIRIFPYLPYILQDLWELGTIPDTMIKLIKKHFTNYSNQKVLDLGCGKGAVSVKLSQQLKCSCYGIDAIEDFITFAQQKANVYNVDQLCKFEVGGACSACLRARSRARSRRASCRARRTRSRVPRRGAR